jgi:uncharacterized protein YlxP (DUF503 family)
MNVGILQLALLVRSAHSLKEKRRVIKSLKERLRNAFNISIAEVGSQDLWQSADLGVAMVGTDAKFVNQVLSQVMNHIEDERDVEVVDSQMEIL